MNPLQDVFISYGRADSKHFAKTLNDRLVALGYTVWFDFEDIPLGVDYQKQIDDGIEKADNFLFLISPHSVNSPYCALEVELALKRNKRIIPLLHVESIDRETWKQRNLDGTDKQWAEYQAVGKHCCFDNMHPEISKINWVYVREGVDDFENALQGLLGLLETDKEYVHQHAILLNKALEWEQNQKQTRYLLTGEDRQEAEKWLAVRFPNKQPPVWPTDLHYEYITESIKNSENLMTQVFLAHAEEDAMLTEKVRRSLMRSGITTWSYRADIEYGDDFEKAIARGVEQADNVLLLMSSHSLKSKYCQQELDWALQLNKRLIIMLAGQVAEAEIPVFLRNRQYIDLTDNENEADYLKDEDDLLRVLKQDATYHNEHKVLLTKALKWERQQRNPCILLQGYELQHALAWREVAKAKDGQGPTELQEEFIEASQGQTAAVAPDVFMSYSRADSDFARRLNNALQQQRKRTWFDQESIASGADFQQEIYKGIERSNFFLFVLSPRSVKSQFCADEVEYAATLNKRVVTVLHRPVNPADLHPELAKVQWIDFTANEGEFDTNFKELLRTLDTDPQHLKAHTQLLMKAIEWDEKGRREDVLLRGSDLEEAEQWMAQAVEKQPSPTALQGEYIGASRILLEGQQQTEAKRQRNAVRRLRLFLAASLLLSCFAIFKTYQAERQRMRAYEATAKGTATTEPLNSRVHGLAAMNIGRSWFVKFPQLYRKDLVPSQILEKANLGKPYIFIESHENTLASGLPKQLSFLANLVPHSSWLEPVDITAIAFSPDGEMIASGGNDGRIRFWRADGRPLDSPEHLHTDEVWSLTFSPDGQRIASGSLDGTIRLWNRQGQAVGKPIGEPIIDLADDENEVASVAFSPDGQLIASGSLDGTIRLWDIEEDAISGPIIELAGHSDWALSLTFSPDGQFIASGSPDGTVRFWNTEGRSIGQPLELNSKIWAMALSPDGQTIATGLDDKTVRLWDLEGRPVGRPLKGHTDSVSSVAFSPDGTLLASGAFDGSTRLWNISDNEFSREMGPEILGQHDAAVIDIAFSPDGKALLSGSLDQTVRLFKIESSPIIPPLEGHFHWIYDLAIDPQRELIASAGSAGAIHLWNSKDQTIRHSLAIPDGFSAVAFSPDGETIISGNSEGMVSLWSREGQLLKTFANGHTLGVVSVAFSPDGQMIASRGHDGSLKLWNAKGENMSPPINNLGEGFIPVRFSPDSQTIITGGENGTIQFWDRRGTLQQEWPSGHRGRVLAIALSPDGETLISGGEDGTIQFWDKEGNLSGRRLKAHKGAIAALAVSPDGTTVVSVGEDSTIRLWTMAGESIGSLESHQQAGTNEGITAVAFSRDGQRIISAGLDNAVRMSPVELLHNGGWVGHTCRQLWDHLLVQSQVNEVAREAKRTCQQYNRLK